ncbi:MAG: competence/damage-inducible protein A [Fimbriimonas sp.]
MTAEIVSVGTELLLGQIVDTHAPVMARILAECGIGCTRRTTVGDNWERLVDTLRQSLSRADVVVTIGGLGPTLDDLTRDAIAAAMGDELERVPEMETQLREFFGSRNIRWTESIARQADRPRHGRFVDNPNGTAPGLICEKDGKVAIALPGPKGEFDPMAYGPVREYLSRLQGEGVIHSRTLRIIGMGESHVEERVRDLMDADDPTVAPYAQTGEVHLRLTSRAANRTTAEARIDPVEAEIRSRLGHHVYGIDKTNLEASVIQLLTAREETVAVAESMTGGELGARLTSVSGSGQAFVGGVIAYTPAVKHEMLGVDQAILDDPGPVSAEVARALAEGTRERFGSTYGIGITGNAGPTADVDGKPVGLVYIGLATPEGTQVEEAHYRGLREDVRFRATQNALYMLRQAALAR